MDNLQLKSLVTAEGYVELFLESSPVPDCAETPLIWGHFSPQQICRQQNCLDLRISRGLER